MKRYKMIFSYDGSAFLGFQTQPGLRTVQGELESAVSYLNGQRRTMIHASGRTDAQVHAKYQVAHFDMDEEIPPYKIKRGINSNTSDDIHVIAVEEVDKDFHARYMVKTKEYEYVINIGEYNPLERNYVFQCCHNLNIDDMKEGIKYLIGEHDYRSFVSEASKKENCVRKITKAKIYQDKIDKNKYHIYFKGTGFLKYQVRNMVGALIKVGEGKIKPIDIDRILKEKDRGKAGKTAPACGLYLIKVNY